MNFSKNYSPDHFTLNKICSLFLILLFGITATLATESRSKSMGQSAMYMHDNSNIDMFPGSLSRYNNQLISELRTKGNDNTFSSGVHLPLGNDAVLGIYLNRQLDRILPAGVAGQLDLNNATDLILGLKLGESDLGIRLTAAFANTDQNNIDSLGSDINETARYFEFAGGMSSATYDFSAFFSLPYSENTINTTTTEWRGNGFGVSGRFFLGPENGIQYVPLVILNNLTTTFDQGSTDTDISNLHFTLGTGLHYQVDEKNLVVMGIEWFSMDQEERDTPGQGNIKLTQTNLPAFYLGGETLPKSWLAVRLGGTYRYMQTRSESSPSNGAKVTNTFRDANFDFTFGLGVVLGNFQLDLDINDRFLFQGPDFVSGQGGNQFGDFANRLSMTFQF